MKKIMIATLGAGLLLAGCSASTPTMTTSSPAPGTTSTAPATTSSAAPTTASPTASVASGEPTPTSSSAAPTTGVPQPTNESAYAAIETAEGAVNGRAVELEWDDQRWELEVLVGTKKQDIKVSPDGRTVVRTDSPEDVRASDVEALRGLPVAMKDAISTALDSRQGVVTEAEIELDVTAWEIEIDDKAKVLVDARTGALR